MIASNDGVPRPITMWEPIASFVTTSQGLSNCDAAPADAHECAELRCIVPTAAIGGHMSMCHNVCRSATLRQALRERGWASAHYLSCTRQIVACCARTPCRAGAQPVMSSRVWSQVGIFMVCQADNCISATPVLWKAFMRGHETLRACTSSSWLPPGLASRAHAMQWSRHPPMARAGRNRQRPRGVCPTKMSSTAEVGRLMQCLTPRPRILPQ